MKEAFGGIFNLFYIALFLVIIMGVLGLVVSYTKAFKMKTAIISVIEEYEGSGCDPGVGGSTNTACINRIKDEALGLNYNPSVHINCDGMTNVENMYCYKKSNIIEKNNKKYVYYTVLTQVDINFPLVDMIMGFRIFQVSGDTMLIQLQT